MISKKNSNRQPPGNAQVPLSCLEHRTQRILAICDMKLQALSHLPRTSEEVQRADKTRSPTLLFIQRVVIKLITYSLQHTMLNTAGDIGKPYPSKSSQLGKQNTCEHLSSKMTD